VLVAERLRVERSGGDGVFARNVRSIAIRASRVVMAGIRGIGAGSNVVGGAVDAVLDDVLVSEAQVQGVVGFSLASATKITLAVARSTVTRSGNSLNGAVRAIVSAGNVDLTLTDSLVEGAGGSGVETVNPGTTLTLSGSTIVRNTSFGVYADPGTVIYTRGNNTIRGNNGADLTSQTFGTITPLAGS
jgi:hypothetical protein